MSGRQPAPAKARCVHHWILNQPNGSMSRGVCKRCNKRRSFPTVTSRAYWLRAKVKTAKS
ncbi:MAG: hypothetical protein IIC26_04605 [Chloroflexi bacterium]|nr:hypothetical protein [Chloroflexota bacterium]